MSAPFGKARSNFSLATQIMQYEKDKSIIFGLLRARTSPQQIAIPVIGSSQGSQGASSGSGNYLIKLGDSMIGPIAFKHLIQSISNPNTLDISKTGPAYSTYVTMVGQVNVTLDTIKGAFAPGQILILQGTLTESFTVRSLTNSGSNIRTINDQDQILKDNDIFVFIFDDVDGGTNAQVGCWHQISYGKSFHLGIAADANNNFIHNVKTPVDCGDAVNKCYVDGLIQIVSNFVGLYPISGNEKLTESILVFDDANREYTNMIATEAMAEHVAIYLSSADNLQAIGGESMSESIATRMTNASISLDSSSGPPGTVVTVTAFDFFQGAVLTLKYNGVVQGTTPASPTVPVAPAGSLIGYDAIVAFTFTTPNLGIGTYVVNVTDGHGNSVNANWSQTS